MNNLSSAVSILFVIVTLITVWQFYNAANRSKKVIAFVIAWMLLQGILGLSGFYRVTQAVPPRFVLLIAPVLIGAALLLLTKAGKSFVDTLSIRKLTLLHWIRIPVEFTLYFVYTEKLVPLVMTFEGNNYDIISGITAPVIYYLVFVTKKLNNTALLLWNFVCLALLINILVIAILSAQTPFQQLAFDQPNIGVALFPFVWLPAVIVPIVLIAHLAAIRQLIKSRNQIPAIAIQKASLHQS